VSHWLFDLEILKRLGEDAVLECPVSQWTHVPGSKVRLIPDGWRTIRDLIRLRRHYGRDPRGMQAGS
jgi:hypothetical protein